MDGCHYNDLHFIKSKIIIKCRNICYQQTSDHKTKFDICLKLIKNWINFTITVNSETFEDFSLSPPHHPILAFSSNIKFASSKKGKNIKLFQFYFHSSMKYLDVDSQIYLFLRIPK